VPRHEVRIAGSAARGWFLSGNLLGTAAMYGNKVQHPGTVLRARGQGRCLQNEVVIADEEISFPMVTSPDFFIALSQEAWTSTIADLPEGKTLIVDEDLVRNIPRRRGSRSIKLPMTRSPTVK